MIPQPAGTGCDTDASYCSYDSILEAQASRMAVFEARGPCIPTERCLAAYLAAAEPGTYIHCKLSPFLPLHPLSRVDGRLRRHAQRRRPAERDVVP